MELIKKYAVKVLCVVALIALFFPMVTVSVEDADSTSLSGIAIAFQGYLSMVLIFGPLAILAVGFVEKFKGMQTLVQAGIGALCIVFTFVGYLQGSSIAMAADAAGGGYVDVSASFGFGGVLCLICHIGILACTLLFQLPELKEELKALKKG